MESYQAMSLLSRAFVFCIRELSRPALEECGKHIGDAIGTVIGKKIDPEHCSDLSDKPDPKKDEPGV